MTIAQQAVRTICDKAQRLALSRITQDLIACDVEELFVPGAELPSRRYVAAVAYQVDVLLEVMNPELSTEVSLLTALSAALAAWVEEIDLAEGILGMQPES